MIAPSLHSSHVSGPQMSSVSPAVLCGQKESVTQLLSDHSSAHRAENDCFAMSHTWVSHEGLRDSWHSLHYRISLQMQFLKFSLIPSPCLWLLAWGSLLFPAFQLSLPYHATSWVLNRVLSSGGHLALSIVRLPAQFILVQLVTLP